MIGRLRQRERAGRDVDAGVVLYSRRSGGDKVWPRSMPMLYVVIMTSISAGPTETERPRQFLVQCMISICALHHSEAQSVAAFGEDKAGL
jgi:hypothetical protein